MRNVNKPAVLLGFLAIAMFVLVVVPSFGGGESEKAIPVRAFEPYTVVDYSTTEDRVLIPDWVFMSKTQIERIPEYRDYHAFVFVKQGRNLNHLKAWCMNFNLAAGLAELGNVSESTIANAQLSTAIKREQFWVTLQYPNNVEADNVYVCRYYILYLIPKK